MSIRVRAKKTGYFLHVLRYPGDVFTIANETEFGRWMERVSDETPEHTTTGTNRLRQVCDDRRGRPLGRPEEPVEDNSRALVDRDGDEDEWL